MKMTIPTAKRSSQERIMKQLVLAFTNATSWECRKMADDSAMMKFEKVSSDCKSRKVNLFRVGVRGGLKVIKQEFTANE
jgi:hypothetical protein